MIDRLHNNPLSDLLDVLLIQAPRPTLNESLSDWLLSLADKAVSAPIAWTVGYKKRQATAHPYVTTLMLLMSIGNCRKNLMASPQDTWLRDQLGACRGQPYFTQAWQDLDYIRRILNSTNEYIEACTAECVLSGAVIPIYAPTNELQVLSHGTADIRAFLGTSESLGLPWHSMWKEWRNNSEAAHLPESMNL